MGSTNKVKFLCLLLTPFSLQQSIRSLEVKVGIDELLDVTVSVENRGENSYNSRVIVSYPTGLSFRKFTPLQVKCQDQFSFQLLSGLLLSPVKLMCL